MGTHLNRYEDTPLMKGWSLRESIKGMSSITKSLREALKECPQIRLKKNYNEGSELLDRLQ
jgi:hypothetical protein